VKRINDTHQTQAMIVEQMHNFQQIWWRKLCFYDCEFMAKIVHLLLSKSGKRQSLSI